MNRLKDRVAIVTGGAHGIGRATVEAFLGEGASVALWDVDEEAGKSTVAEFERHGALIRFQHVDVADFAAVEEATRRTAAEFDRIDILVNNAGILRDSSMKKMTPTQWRQVIDVNLTGVFHCAKAVYPYMAERGYGRILNASSVVAHHGNFGQSNYVASKAAVIGLTKTWAREFGRKGITVNAVAPGFIRTEMIDAVPKEMLVLAEAHTPLQRMGEPEEVAAAYLFLASEDAGFITGAVLNVDGGLVF